MLGLENPEEVLMILDRYRTLKQKNIPKELDEYLSYVAKTGDPVYSWSTIQYLFREKLTTVIREFHDTTPSLEDLPPCPNVDAFNYENLKTALLERLDLFHAAPFTVQRLCELLTNPKKHYCRLDKFMRALEKNILVVSTIEPGRKRVESENGDALSLDVSLDSDIERDVSGPASASVVAVAVAAKEEIVHQAVKAAAGQSKLADDSITDDTDVEVKDSSELVPPTLEDTKHIEVDDEPTVAVAEPAEKPSEDIQIDVVEEIKEEKPVESVSKNTADVLTTEAESLPTEGEPEAKTVPVENEAATTASSSNVASKSAENLVAADSSVPDAIVADAVIEPVETLAENKDNVTTTLKTEPELNDAISSTDDVATTTAVTVTKAPITEEDDDSECKPSSPKIPRLEQSDVGTISVQVDVVVDPVAESIESDTLSTPSDVPSQEVISTSTDTKSALDKPSIVAAAEIITPEVVASAPIEADSTEPETEIAADALVTSAPVAEPIITESIVAVEVDAAASVPVAESAEVASSDDIPEVMAVEEEQPASSSSVVVDSTAVPTVVATAVENAAIPVGGADTTAMDATPIIPSDEQMDVDEANSADSMDL